MLLLSQYTHRRWEHTQYQGWESCKLYQIAENRQRAILIYSYIHFIFLVYLGKIYRNINGKILWENWWLFENKIKWSKMRWYWTSFFQKSITDRSVNFFTINFAEFRESNLPISEIFIIKQSSSIAGIRPSLWSVRRN